MLNALQNTPPWVYALFVLLCYLGIKALSPTRESRTSLLITPPILLAWSLYSLNLSLHPALSLGFWLVAVLVGSAAALLIFSSKDVRLDAKGTGLMLPGTSKTLVLYLLLFAVNYYFGYEAEVHPQLSKTLPVMLLKACASGIASGLFCGRSIKFYQVFRSLKIPPATNP
ncbi:DUF6622 family protein [Pseudomonas mandelii]|uniref:DUF6622 family protein n=1 Tax=Pseudomonas mandelii TaxID=75612 RepID=UPI00224AE429|nr:DUF6622 family protein [Pseudomonas mandelii]MCX2897020.1 hypothetical protein [Pseudomonas mandelii]